MFKDEGDKNHIMFTKKHTEEKYRKHFTKLFTSDTLSSIQDNNSFSFRHVIMAKYHRPPNGLCGLVPFSLYAFSLKPLIRTQAGF